MKNFSRLRFSGQRTGEEIILVVRRHWFDILQQMFLVFLMALLLAGSYVFLPDLFPALNGELLNGFFLFLENIFAILVWIILFLVWIDYYFDVWIITNQRIIDISQKGLFSRDVSELRLEKIQDVTTEVRGVIPTFLNYGDVDIQTAGEKERFLFHDVPDPYQIKDLIMNLQKRIEKEKADSLGEIIQEKISQEFS